jgi:curli biogenesis system outer membrane secretion channel CsgG
MRMPRTVIAALAICLVGLVPFAASTSASAAEPAAKAAGASAEARRALAARVVKFEFKAQRRSTYKFYGKVQDGNRSKIILLRADKKKGKYRTFRTDRTNTNGGYSWTGLSKTGYYYVKVPGNATWATSYSQLIHVYYPPA